MFKQLLKGMEITMSDKHELKRLAIEKEIRSIVLSDSRAILADNMKRIRQRLGNLRVGDTVLLFEYIGKKRLAPDDMAEALYRMTEGTVIQVTKSGFFIDGVNGRGHKIREFVNNALIINGRVRLLLAEKTK